MKNDISFKYMETPVIATFYLIIFAAMPGINDSERVLNLSMGSQQENDLNLGPDILSSVISQMEDSIKGKLSCVVLMVDKSAYNMDHSIPVIQSSNGERLPVIIFNLDIKLKPSNVNNIDLASKSCPNYIVISSTAERITKFVKTFESSLRRQNSHYVLFVPRNETISLDDMSFFDKVLKYATIALDVSHSENPEVKNMTLEDLRNQNIINDGMVYARDKIKYEKIVPIGKLNKIRPHSNLFPSDLTSNMYGKNIRGSSFDHRPYTYISDEIDGLKVYDGSELKMMESMSDVMNFTFSIVPPSDGTTFGEEIEPGNFTGVFGELQKDNADIIWADLWVKLNRYKHFDFTYPYRIEQVCFMVKMPPPRANWLAPVMPFQKEVWFVVFLAVFVAKLLPQILKYLGIKRRFWTNMVLTVLPLMFFQTKLLYKGNLISQLTVESSIQPIDTLKELALENDDIPVGCFTNYLQKYVKTSTNPYILKIAETFQAYYDYEKAFEEAFNGRLVMGESKEFAEYNIRTRFTNKYGVRSMHIMKECIKPIGVAFVLQKDSILTSQFNKKISQLVESGLTDKWMQDEFEKVAKKLSEKSSIKFESLLINHLQGLFFFWTMLLLASTVIFLAELFYGNFWGISTIRTPDNTSGDLV